MPRQRILRRHYLNLASLINRARHHPYNLRRSTIRRGLHTGLTSATIAAQTIHTQTNGVNMTPNMQRQRQRNQQIAAQTLAMAMSNCRPVRPHNPPPQLRKRQQQRYPRLRSMLSAVVKVSGDHLHLAEVQIAERALRGQHASRKRRHESPKICEKPSTIVLHRNPRFNALGITRSGMLRQDTNNSMNNPNSNNNENYNENFDNGKANNVDNNADPNIITIAAVHNNVIEHDNGTQEGIDAMAHFDANVDNEAIKVETDMREAGPSARKSSRKKNNRAASRAKNSGRNSPDASTSSKEIAQSTTTAVSRDNSKTTSDVNNSFDGTIDDVFLKPRAPKTIDKINKEIQAKVAKRFSRKRKIQTVPDTLLPITMPSPMLLPSLTPGGVTTSVPAVAIDCPTLSTILLSVDNFLKRRRMASCTR